MLHGNFTNWAQNVTCRPARWAQPRTELELQETLAAAADRGDNVRVTGAGHSWSPLCWTDGTMINLDRMSRIVAADPDTGRVVVEAGIRLKELNAQLAGLGLAMPILGSVSEQSAAGVVSTGTHGSSTSIGNISTVVSALKLVRADGEVVEMSRDEGAPFQSAALSVGSLGVLSELTLDCVPAFNLEERAVVMSFDEAMNTMLGRARGHEFCKLWWLPHTDFVMVFTYDRTDREPTVGPDRRKSRLGRLGDRVASRFGASTAQELLDKLVNDHVFTAVLDLGRRRPDWVPALNDVVRRSYFQPTVRVDRSDRMFNVAMPPIHREMEYGIDLDEAPDFLRRVKEMLRREQIMVNFVVEIRFVAQDDLPLSNAYGRDSCQVGAYIGECRDLSRFFRSFEEMALEAGGRPHWGKEFAARRSDLDPVIPLLGEFADLREEMDPERRFVNPLLERVFDLR